MMTWHGLTAPKMRMAPVASVETLFTIMGPGCESVARVQTKDAELVTGVWKGGRVGTFRGLRAGKQDYGALVFGAKGIAPSGGYCDFFSPPSGAGCGGPVQWVYHLILPWISIALLQVGFYSRVLRSNLLDMVNQDFVRTARAKGLSRRQVFVNHVLRNSMMPVVTMFGLDFAALLGGAALVTERVFNIPGIGQYEAQAIGNLDVPPILVGALFTAFFVVLLGALVDILYAVLDPRIRLTG